MSRFKSGKEAKRALYEASLQCGVSIRALLDKEALRKSLSACPVLGDVLAYFGGENWQREKASADAELLAFGETCAELARSKPELEGRGRDRIVTRGRSVCVSRSVSRSENDSEGRSHSFTEGTSYSYTESTSKSWTEGSGGDVEGYDEIPF